MPAPWTLRCLLVLFAIVIGSAQAAGEAPTVPQNLQGSIEGSQVALSWSAASDSDDAVEGYNVYRNNRYFTTVQTNSYIGEVEPDTGYSFSVVAFDAKPRRFSTRSARLRLPEGIRSADPGVAPSVPDGLAGDTSTADGQTRVMLSWQPATGPAGVAGYNVYRNNQYLSTVLDTAYADTVESGQVFAWSVVAFDDFGNFSPRSVPLNLLGDGNHAPFFSSVEDQNARVGERWSLLLSPVDLDGGAAGILTSELPVGMEFLDNRDGTRSLQWAPTASDVGVYDITVTAFDLADAELRTSQSFKLTVQGGEQPGDEPPGDEQPGEAPFSIAIAGAAYNLQEGAAEGVRIPISLTRSADATDRPITLAVSAEDPALESRLTARFANEELQAGDSQTTLTLVLAIDTLPIASSQRRIIVSATDGTATDTASLTVAVTPVARDDVYLLIGQSNMIGSSEAGARRDGPGEADEPNLRISQANVTVNDQAGFPSTADFTALASNFEQPRIVTARDPLHDPVDPGTLGKAGTTIGLGLSFAKRALGSTTRSIVLVPAAWSGSGFCGTTSVPAQWNAQPTENPALGNTLLFDRALARVNQTLQDTGGVLRGILWHQGETDSNSTCATFYEANLKRLVAGLRSRIVEDARGSIARGADADIPFVLGTMSRGKDERGDFSALNTNKSLVDSVHRNIASLVPFSEVSVHDDLVPANGYPCGGDSCIHFGSGALREMGSRYFDALIRAAGR